MSAVAAGPEARVAAAAQAAAEVFDGALAVTYSPDRLIVDLHFDGSPVTVTIFASGREGALSVQRFTGGRAQDLDATVACSPGTDPLVVGAVAVALLRQSPLLAPPPPQCGVTLCPFPATRQQYADVAAEVHARDPWAAVCYELRCAGHAEAGSWPLEQSQS